MKHRIVASMPMITVFLFLFSGLVLENWKLGVSFFLLIPLSWILIGNNLWRRINQSMPLISFALFLWLGFSELLPFSIAWVVFLLIPLSNILLNGRIHVRQFVTIGISVVYIVIGITTGAWHPWWLLFLLIPIINTIFFPNKNRVIFMNKDEIRKKFRAYVNTDEDDDDIEYF